MAAKRDEREPLEDAAPVLLRSERSREEDQERDGPRRRSRTGDDAPAPDAAPPAARAAAAHAPLEEKTTMSTSEAIARNARVPSRKILGLSQRSHARTNAPFGLLAARRSEIAEARREELQVTAEPSRARPRHRRGRGSGLVERERAAQSADGDAFREERERRLGILGRRPRRGRRPEAERPRREAHRLAAQTHGQALGVAREVVGERASASESASTRGAPGAGTPAGRTGS